MLGIERKKQNLESQQSGSKKDGTQSRQARDLGPNLCDARGLPQCPRQDHTALRAMGNIIHSKPAFVKPSSHFLALSP